MAALAACTWWLVKNTPLPDLGSAPTALRHEPDYTMTQFLVQRFAANGTLQVQIEGDRLQHFPDTDTLEIDSPRIRAYGDNGRVTRATARHALANHDGTELQLSGDAHIVRQPSASDAAIEFRGELLQCFQNTERVRSTLPVQIIQGRTEVRAAAMDYDNRRQLLDLTGPVQAVLVPPP
jgi:lipopolysaccharide export system protein LptC